MVHLAGSIRLGDVRRSARLFLSAPLGQGGFTCRVPLVDCACCNRLVDTLRADLGSGRRSDRIPRMAPVDMVAP